MAAKKKQAEADTDKDPKFEDGMADLEEMVKRLETGSVPLEESLATFEKGVSLVRVLQAKLDSVQEKIEELTRTGRGELTTRPLETDED